MGRKEEEEKVDFMRHQFPLKNGREQRARWSFALSLSCLRVRIMATTAAATAADHFQGQAALLPLAISSAAGSDWSGGDVWSGGMRTSNLSLMAVPTPNRI